MIPKSPKRQLGPISVLFLAVFIDLVGFGIVIPLLPFWAESLGASPFIYGILLSSYSAMQFIFSPIWGRISDSKGRRPVILVGLVGTILFTIFLIWIGGRVFRVAILLQGTPPKLKNFVRWAIRG